MIDFHSHIIPNIDEAKMSWTDRLFNPFIAINTREDPCWFIVVRVFLIIFIVALCVIGFFFPKIPKNCYYLIKHLMISIFSYGKKKIEDIHYHRNDVTLRDGSEYLEDLDNI